MPISKRPNILFFFTDDQRFDTIRALGNNHVITPNMDALVERGTAFVNAHIMGGSSGAVCMPSRAMLMTGRTLYHLQDQGQQIPDDHIMLGEVLQKAGYTTFGTGKWHNGPASYARSFSAGAEIFFGGMDDHWNVPACDFDPAGKYDVLHPVCRDPFHSNRVHYRHCDHVSFGKHSSELFSDAAIDFLQSYNSAAPFFMYISFMAPHDPRTMPQEYLALYDPATIPLPENFLPEHPFNNGDLLTRDEKLEAWPRKPKQIRRHIAEYYAMITHLDAQIGRVLLALEKTGYAKNTIIVLAGDNGLAIGQHGLMGKQNLYQHSVRVPLILSGPGVPQAEKRQAFCYLLDIYPTLCDMIDVPIPDTVEGVSMGPTLCDASATIRDTLLLAYQGVQRAVLDRQHKLIEYVVDGQRSTQLFDLETDPWELDNLAESPIYADRVAYLRTELLHWPDELDDTQVGQGKLFWEDF